MNLAYLAIAAIVVAIIMAASNKRRMEGFVKYYQQPNGVGGYNDFLGSFASSPPFPSDSINLPNKEFYKVKSQEYLENTFQEYADEQHVPYAALKSRLGNLMKPHDDVYDVQDIMNTLENVIAAKLTEVSKRLAYNREYLFVNPIEIEALSFSDGTKYISVSIDIHDVTKDLVNPYIVHVRLHYFKAKSDTYLDKINYLEQKTPRDDGPRAYDKSMPENELFENSQGLPYPWRTSLARSGLSLTDAEKKEILEEHQSKSSESKFYCFGVPNISPGDTGTSREECERMGGFVDEPVRDNTKCKYYMANKNYPNRRGGARYGYCEGPLGTQKKSFSKFDPNPLYTPLCYNCKRDAALNKVPGGIGPCCEDQEANLTEYNLLTADYAFPGDAIDRRMHEGEFKKRGLSWHRFGTQDEYS